MSTLPTAHTPPDSEDSDLSTDQASDDDSPGYSQPFVRLSERHRQVAQHFFDCGDESTAYMRVYTDVKNRAAAKKRGRAVLQRPEVAEFLSILRRQSLVSPEQSAADRNGIDRLAWLAEVRHMAFSTPGGKGRISHRDKRESLKLYGEAQDWFPKGVQAQGVRAVFHIRIGNKLVLPGGQRLILDNATGLPLDSPENLLTNQRMSGLPDEDSERSEESGKRTEREQGSLSASASASLQAANGGELRRVAADGGAFQGEIVDLIQESPENTPIPTNNKAEKRTSKVRFVE